VESVGTALIPIGIATIIFRRRKPLLIFHGDTTISQTNANDCHSFVAPAELIFAAILLPCINSDAVILKLKVL
jgi:hypothetical protein